MFHKTHHFVFSLIFMSMAAVLVFSPALYASWITPDWAGKEPEFAPGSFAYHTNQYPRCPVLFRTVLSVEGKPLSFACFRAKASAYAYVFLNGKQIAAHTPGRNESSSGFLNVELTHLLKPGRNVLIVSASEEGFSLKGALGYADGQVDNFVSGTDNWAVQKFAPLTMIDFEPCMKADFDDSDWFSVESAQGRDSVEISNAELQDVCESLKTERLKKLDEYAGWKLEMLSKKGIAIVDRHTYGWAGPHRLAEWVPATAAKNIENDGKAGFRHNVAEALTRYVYLNDEKTNLANYAIGLDALGAPAKQKTACSKAFAVLAKVLSRMERQIKAGRYADAVSTAADAEDVVSKAKNTRIINDLCCCVENKFGWFDTNALLNNDVTDWGLSIDTQADVLASPLSPAALITVRDDQFVLSGWDTVEPFKVYNKPANVGPVLIWAVIDGKVKVLKPDDQGVVYDRASDGELDENWILLVNNMAAGGPLPTELVFVNAPTSIRFQAGAKATEAVKVGFAQAGSKLFVLKPIKEWRGFLQMAKDLTSDPINSRNNESSLKQCRFFSRALLNYPVTFSEAFIEDPDNKHSLIVADVYNYRNFKDDWGTEPMKVAPLPALASYGLMMNYPGLEVISDSEKLGSRGVYGDRIGVVGQDHIVYRVPFSPIKRFGGFTSYCFGPTDIGEPGSDTEVGTVKLSGSNSYRPQHNQTGPRAIKTLEFCWKRGIQNMFNCDEKWVPDIVEHFRTLAEKCRDYPPDAVAYDLLNEPETRVPEDYDALIRKITNAIREVDKKHLIYVEAFPPWGPGAKPFPKGAFDNLKPTGDERTVYSFHDYEFRLPPRWPNEKEDIRTILDRWVPVFKFSIEHQVPIHLGEFGAFEQTKQSVYTNPCAETLMMDYFRIFDQFGWHFNYYANRGTTHTRQDGSMTDSYVQDAYRRYFGKGTFNFCR